MNVKIVYAVLFLTVAIAAVGFWFWQQNPFSTGNVRLEIIAPEEVTMGEEITYVVKWKNVGEIEVGSAELVFEYPEGSLPTEDKSLRVSKIVDDINPGQEESVRFTARILGKENELKEAKAFLSYTPKNLSASFRSETSATSKISFVPLNFELDMPSRMEAGQRFAITLNYFSNVNYPLSNLRVQMEYPDGFEFESAIPSPLGDNEWDVGVLNRASGDRITVQGALRGGVEETKLFKATLGTYNEGKLTVLAEVTKAVQITKPQLFITQTVNASPQYAASVGDTLHYEIFFKNPSDRILENLFLIVTLDGRGFDLDSVKVDKGRFQKGDNSVVWEAKDNPKLRFLGRGEEGKVEFWINVKGEIETFSPQDKDLLLKDRVLLSDATEEFSLKVKSDLEVAQVGFFQDEVFGNQGTQPPQVGQRNTYTITWQATNRYADAQNAKVKAILPPGVELTGEIFPEDASLTYDSGSREVVWEIGDMAAGTGVFSELPAASVAFQIAFTPTSVHRGKVAELIGQAHITGEDVFVDQLVSGTDDAIDTTLPDDDSVSEQDGVVE
ncbi:MAG TPA: hypothetical protein VGA53_02005 [Candidatus Paceibacterota bacterium]